MHVYDIDPTEVPVFICNRNNLERGFRRQVEWLLNAGMKYVNVVENGSTYPPLVEYYKKMSNDITVLPQASNIGPRGWWELKQHERVLTPYIYTDCDVVPSDTCPADLIAVLLSVLQTQETGRKVGVSLRTDNLPDHFSKKDLVIKWESGFWNPDRRIDSALTNGVQVFNADVDTTFAMYHPQQSFTYTALRTDAPYSLEHIPWYNDEANPTDEDLYYRAHYETAHENGQMWKTNEGGWALYGWNVRTRASMEDTFRKRGIELDGKPRW